MHWYNNKDVVPTLEAMQKMIAFCHNKDIDMLNFECKLPSPGNICLQISTDAKFNPFTEGDKDLLEKSREDVVGGRPSITFTRKAFADETFIQKSTNKCKSIVGLLLANYTPTRCGNQRQPIFIRVGISVRRRVDSDLDRTRPSGLEIWSCPFSKDQKENVKLKVSIDQAHKRKLTVSVLMGFALIRTLCLKRWVSFTTFVSVRK